VKDGVEYLTSAVGMGVAGMGVALTICGVEGAGEEHEETTCNTTQRVMDKERKNWRDMTPDYTILV
jgi:hypothetical protein